MNKSIPDIILHGPHYAPIPADPMTDDQRTTLELALRVLGNRQGFRWGLVKDAIWGIKLLAINLHTVSGDLDDVTVAANHLFMEMD